MAGRRRRSTLARLEPRARLVLQARSKLPKHTSAVWRGVKLDLTSQFPKGKKLWWWAFNSTSKHVSTLLNPMFCGTSGERTQFMIEASSGVDIGRFSMVDSEAEVLTYVPAHALTCLRTYLLTLAMVGSEAEALLFPGTRWDPA